MTRIITALLALGLVAAVAVACSAAPSTAPSTSSSSGWSMGIADAWARPGSKGAGSAAYFTITSDSAAGDVLLGASTTAASEAQVHESSTDAEEMTGMHPVESIAIPAGASVAFEPGGFHVMLNGLTRDLVAGDTFQLTLTFGQAGAVTVPVEVRAN